MEKINQKSPKNVEKWMKIDLFYEKIMKIFENRVKIRKKKCRKNK